MISYDSGWGTYTTTEIVEGTNDLAREIFRHSTTPSTTVVILDSYRVKEEGVNFEKLNHSLNYNLQERVTITVSERSPQHQVAEFFIFIQ